MRLLHLTCFASLLLTSFAQNQIELFGHSISCIRKKCRKPANDILRATEQAGVEVSIANIDVIVILIQGEVLIKGLLTALTKDLNN